MVRSFDIVSLNVDQVGAAFPLVQASMPKVDLALWRKYATPLVEATDDGSVPPFGIVGVRNAANYLCGLFAYRVATDFYDGTILAIDLFTALDLVNANAATQALLDAADDRARRHGCASIHLRMGPEQEPLADSILRAGHVPYGRVFHKRIEASKRVV